MVTSIQHKERPMVHIRTNLTDSTLCPKVRPIVKKIPITAFVDRAVQQNLQGAVRTQWVPDEDQASCKSNCSVRDCKKANQTQKIKEDSVSKTQLMCLETQRKSCPNEARDELLDDLKKKTLHWASVREKNNCPRQQTDKFAAQIYEILDKGKTDQAFNHRPRPVITEKTIRETMPHIMKGRSRIGRENPQLKPSLERDAQDDDFFDHK
ncbi:hypothetical protein MAR_002158 [Mya arenaria]|uniref:Uncharacterized protein n=1 Tax=Mya arenaria TaxID=6604 RepID=A0ABY7FDU2_MYAAR|nr:hypothetical protein MAR_002158 [Mya arenaria]